jgi:hypothetical protein
MRLPEYLAQMPELPPLLDNADHVDVKTAEGKQNLREFIAGALSYQPAWMTFMYGVRMIFVRFLGMKQPGIPRAKKFTPSDISFNTGDKANFFKVADAQEDRYWAVYIDDKHLKAQLIAVVEPLANGLNRFYTITVVHYHNWAGPVYFNLIRPLHHIVVTKMTKAGVKAKYAKITA